MLVDIPIFYHTGSKGSSRFSTFPLAVQVKYNGDREEEGIQGRRSGHGPRLGGHDRRNEKGDEDPAKETTHGSMSGNDLMGEEGLF